MIDRLGRNIHYLRISLTERCNLKCIYCREESAFCKAKGELTCEEISGLMARFAALGITKVRLTGGEPLVRRDLEQIVRLVASYPQIQDLAMTTNAQGLAERAHDLRRAGLHRVNISMDSMDAVRYERMTRGGSLKKVLAGIDEALREGMRVKLNVVLVRGENDGEIDDFIALAQENPIDVRFIELMPFGRLGESGERRVLGSEILETHPELYPVRVRYASQPSEDYSADGFRGRVGFINPISHRFCGDCNRVRLTSDGRLRLCLGREVEIDLRTVLREQPDSLLDVMREAIYQKPENHAFLQQFHAARAMNQIGG